MIRVVLFDADGVVIDKEEQFGDYFARMNGVELEKMQPFYKGVFLECVRGKKDLKVVIEPYLKEWGYEGLGEDFLREWFEFEHRVNGLMVDYVRDLRGRGVACYLATNQERYRAEYMMGEMGLGEVFEGNFVSCEVGHMKEEVDFWKKVLGKLGGVKVEEVLFWDDEEMKLEAARRVGIRGERYLGYEDFRERMRRCLG